MIWWLTGVALALLWCWWSWRQAPEDPLDVFDSDYPASEPTLTEDERRALHTSTQPIRGPGSRDSDFGRLR